jgi:hypothetical protein
MLVNEETIFSQNNVFLLPLHTRIEKQVAAMDGVMGRRDDGFACIFPQPGNSLAQCVAPVLEFYFIVCRDCQAIITLYASLELQYGWHSDKRINEKINDNVNVRSDQSIAVLSSNKVVCVVQYNDNT